MARLVGLLVIALCAAACGRSTAAADAGVADAGVADAAINCHGRFPTAFPLFDSTCQTAGDCVLVSHQVDCCDMREFVVVAQSAANAFAEAESTCEAEYGPCGCPHITDAGFIHFELGWQDGGCTMAEIPPDAGGTGDAATGGQP